MFNSKYIGQLNGTIPSTDEGQRQDSSNLIDASSIDVKVMAQFDMGGSFGSKDDDTGRPDMSNFDFSNMQMPSGMNFTGFGQNSMMSKLSNIIIFALCFVLMIIAIVVLKHYKRV